MTITSVTVSVSDPDETARLAAALADELSAGDVILLQGDVGAGKTHFARAAILSLLEAPEDIPSPTFTLVQTYLTRSGMIWHSDLYRLGSTQEIEELGLAEAFEEAICFVEWPDRLGERTPIDALTLSLTASDAEDGRQIEARWRDPKWKPKLAQWIT